MFGVFPHQIRVGSRLPLFDVGAFGFNYLLLPTSSSPRLGADECRPMIFRDGGICHMLLVLPPLLKRGGELFGFIVCFSDGCFCSVRLVLPMAASAGPILETGWSLPLHTGRSQDIVAGQRPGVGIPHMYQTPSGNQELDTLTHDLWSSPRSVDGTCIAAFPLITC